MKTEEELCDFLGKDLNKIEKLCRICLSDNLCSAVLICKDSQRDTEAVEILEEKLNMDGELSLWEKIAVFGRVKVKYEDDLLKYICEQCCYDVDVAYTFRIKCYKAQNLLKRVLQNLMSEQNIWELREQKDSGSYNVASKVEFVEIPIIDETRNINKLNIKKECTDHLEEDCVDADYSSVDENAKQKIEKKRIKEHLKNNLKTDAVDVKTEGSCQMTNEADNNTENTTKNNQSKEYTCTDCHKSLPTKRSFIKHMKLVHDKEREKILEYIKQSGADKHIQCPECEFRCKQQRTLEYHMATHTGARPYSCDQCGKRYSQPSVLNKHKNTHSDVMQYSCEECGKQFHYKNVLLRHIQTHNTQSNFKCHICNKALKTQIILDDHIKRHLQIKNYNCETCGKCFVTRTDLLMHLLTHNKTKMFKCTECSYSTSIKSKLKLHSQRHTDERPFKCDQCDYSGSSIKYLKSHLKKHSKEAKFYCPACDVKFRHKCSLNKHMVRKHGEGTSKLNESE